MKFTIRTGSLRAEVEAECYQDAAKKLFSEAPAGTTLGQIFQVKPDGAAHFYVSTEKFLRENGCWGEPEPSTEMVSLHPIYCDCERCAKPAGKL